MYDIYIYKYIYRKVHNKSILGLFSIVYYWAFVRHFARAFPKVGKIRFPFWDSNNQIEILTIFLVSNLLQSKKLVMSIRNNYYVEIFILIEQHSNCRLSCAASQMTRCLRLSITLDNFCINILSPLVICNLQSNY